MYSSFFDDLCRILVICGIEVEDIAEITVLLKNNNKVWSEQTSKVLELKERLDINAN